MTWPPTIDEEALKRAVELAYKAGADAGPLTYEIEDGVVSFYDEQGHMRMIMGEKQYEEWKKARTL